MATRQHNLETRSVAAEEPQLRDLFLFTAGNRIFAIPADEVEGTAEAKCATSLPHAPRAILGVVYARGRMLTAIDPVAIAGDDASPWPRPIPNIISLRGDEQLALAAESISETITISSSDIQLASDSTDKEAISAVLGILRHGGKKILILDPPRLFDAAVQRRERRRRRF